MKKNANILREKEREILSGKYPVQYPHHLLFTRHNGRKERQEKGSLLFFFCSSNKVLIRTHSSKLGALLQLGLHYKKKPA